VRIVLLSGGWDSALSLGVAVSQGRSNLKALFVNYGQPYWAPEANCSAEQAHRAGVPHMEVRMQRLPLLSDGCFPNRNLRLLDVAAEEGATQIYFGTRCPWPIFDRYGDGNAVVLRRHATGLGVRLELPALWLPKFVVRRRVRKLLGNVPVFSTEGWRP
jgi:hypothetical protein